MNFENLQFGETISTVKTQKWREFTPGVYKITNKSSIQSRYGQSYILDLLDENNDKHRVYTPKFITDYLNNNNPSYIKVSRNGDTNEAQFA